MRCDQCSVLIQPVVVAIRPKEKIGDNAVAERRTVGSLLASLPGGRVGEIEDAIWRSHRAAPRIDAIRAVDVEAGIDVVSRRRISAIRDPAEVVERRQFAYECERGSADRSALNAGAGRRRRRAQRIRTVVVLNGVSDVLRLVVGDVLAPEQAASLCIDENGVRIDGLPQHH